MPELATPAGRWAMQDAADGSVIGGVILLPLPPGDNDLEIGWQLRPDVWGQGYATEATHGVAGWAFTQDIDEIFAVVRPGNARAAATAQAQRNVVGWRDRQVLRPDAPGLPAPAGRPGSVPRTEQSASPAG